MTVIMDAQTPNRGVTVVTKNGAASEPFLEPPIPAPKPAPVPVNGIGVEIERLGTATLLVPIVGTAPLIVNHWSAKAKQQMLDTQTGKKSVKKIRNPQQDYQDSLYRTPNGYGFPVLAFKSATVSAARFYGKSVSMVSLRTLLMWEGVPSADQQDLLVPITGTPRMREDMVRVGQGGTDLRYRGEFLEWSAVLAVRYFTSSLSEGSVLSLIEAGGVGVGVGEWRPERSGVNGTYRIDENREILRAAV